MKAIEPVYYKIADNIRSLRKNRNLSQLEMAALSGVKRSTIASMENGNARAMLHELLKIADVFKIELKELLP